MPDELDGWSNEFYAEFWAYQTILEERYETDPEKNFWYPVYKLLQLS
jgi:hypothetical protein